MPNLFSFSSDREKTAKLLNVGYNLWNCIGKKGELFFKAILWNGILKIIKEVEMERRQYFVYKELSVAFNRDCIEEIEKKFKGIFKEIWVLFKKNGKEVVLLYIPWRYFEENRRLIWYVYDMQYAINIENVIQKHVFDECVEKSEKSFIWMYYIEIYYDSLERKWKYEVKEIRKSEKNKIIFGEI